MTPTPTQALEPVEVTQAALIDEIIAMYHTTRLAGTPAAAHILSKASAQKAFARFERDTIERHRQSSNAAGVGVDVVGALESALVAIGSDTLPIVRRAARIRIKHALASLSAPTAEPMGDALREAAIAFIAKYEECEPHISDAFLHRQLRCGPYEGPTIVEELAAMRRALSATPPAQEEGA